MAALLTGLLAALSLGKGLPAPPGESINRFAEVENIRLPAGARNLSDLKSFVVRFRGQVDDFGRIYVNNREVIASGFAEPFKNVTWNDPKEAAALTSRLQVNRSASPDTEADVRRWLRRGVNWIMIELENSRWGACSATAEFIANGNQLEGSPYFVPRGEHADRNLSPEPLRRRFTKLADQTREHNAFGIVPENDALCARLIFPFRLY
ncbi:MAG: hypothetical protein ACXWVB_04030 [Rhodoplanes sp.]